MKKQYALLLAILSLTLAMLACQAVTGSKPTNANPTSSDKTMFQDNFDGKTQNWGTGTDSDSSVEYTDGGLRFQVFRTNYFIWSGFNDKYYMNARIEVTAKNNSADPNAAFGVICYQGTNDEDMYYGAITANGEYAIAKGAAGSEDLFLTNDDSWGNSDLIPVNAASYRIGLECGIRRLTLFVNGQKIDSVEDSSYLTGTAALFAWSADEENGVDVTFDDFTITELP